MLRTLRRFGTIAAVIGISCAPGTAIAADVPAHTDPPGKGAVHRGTGDHNQVAGRDINNINVAGRDINNAGRDNIVGSSVSPGGPVAGQPSLTIINNTSATATRTSQTGTADFPSVIPSNNVGFLQYTPPVSAVYQVGSSQVTISVTQVGSGTCDTTGRVRCDVQFDGNTLRFTLTGA